MLPELTESILNDNPDNKTISMSMQLVANLSRIPQFRKQFRKDFDQTVRPTLIEVLGEFLFYSLIWNFGQKNKKIEILVKKVLSKIEILVKNLNLFKYRNCG